jgi:hypothetical protein
MAWLKDAFSALGLTVFFAAGLVLYIGFGS